MKLKVLAGAKKGTEIPLKKEKFVIGRASDCTLRAGSEAISRHHCVVLRRDTGVAIRDLGSRNGTFVNDKKVEGDQPLANGDRVRVGPLEFVFEGAVDLARDKKPKVNGVAEALERAAKQADTGAVEEDDISSWLLGPGPDAGEQAMRETQHFRMDETQAIGEAASRADDENATIDASTLEEEAEEEEDASKGDAKKPGKLPKLPPKPQAKDSREAAADILRELARRR